MSASNTVASFRQRVQAREVLLGTFLQLASPVATEIVAGAGFDWLLVDLEHGADSEATLIAEFQACSGNAVPAMVTSTLANTSPSSMSTSGIVAPRRSHRQPTTQTTNAVASSSSTKGKAARAPWIIPADRRIAERPSPLIG